ncbi:hypothetical protein [Nostoc sp. FACHB-280]|uniref:hypothetical protein n=1 Tax=Nostoc sp. FACHB-280 TaxID=2692839 RepID=UPI00168A4847|nr:hypothetical protein [Nostoc sp. FACHB-280]MBD2495004.1 hypothetical protein [Nostoc sp. FACHB-280]
MGLYRGRKSLQRALLLLQTTGATTTDLPEPPNGTKLHEYWELATGKKKLTYTRSASSKPGKKVGAKIHPFSIDVPATNPVATLVKYSNRAQGVISTHIGAASDLNHITADGTDSITRRGFKAATITVFNPTGTETATTSKVLGGSYKKREGASYTFPFGSNATNTIAYAEVRADLLSKALAKNGDASVTFNPEVLK